jgi:two-component system, OmpR family, response regulator
VRRAGMAGTMAAATSGRRKRAGELTVDLDGRAVATQAGVDLQMTTAEYDLLVCFIEHPRRVLSRDQLLDWTRGRQADPLDRTIDVTVSRLRSRLAPHAPEVVAAITTVRNGGYLFALPVTDL